MRGQQVALLLLILSVAAVVRFYGIGNNSLWTDEFYSLQYSCGHGIPEETLPRDVIIEHPIAPTRLRDARPIAEIPHAMQQDTHPPLYPILLRIWRTILGEGEVAARSLSALLSILSVLLLYLTVRLLSDENAALWSAALLAVAASQVEFAHETRSYAMLLTVLLACCWTIVRIETSGATPARSALLAVFAIVAMLTHYYAAPPLAAIFIYALVRLRGRDRRFVVYSLLIAGVIWTAAWGPFMWRQRANFSNNMEWVRDPSSDGLVVRRLTDAALLPAKYLLPIPPSVTWPAFVSMLLYVIPAVLLRRSRGVLLWWLIMILSITVVLATDLLCASWMIQLLRYTTAASAATCVLLILSIHGFADRWRHIVSAAVLLLTLALLPPVYNITRPDFRSLANHRATETGSDDALVILQPPTTPWYSDVLYMATTQYAHQPPGRLIAITHPANDATLTALSSAKTIWVIGYGGSDLPALLPGARVIDSKQFPPFAVLFRVELGSPSQ